MKKIVRNVLIWIVVLIVAVLVARNMIIKAAATRAIERATGFSIEMEGFSMGLLKPTFEIRGLKLINPEEFVEPTAFEINRFFVNYDLLSLFSDEIHLRNVVIDVPRVVVVEKEDGETNFGRLAEKSRELSQKREGGEREPQEQPPAPREEPQTGEPPQESPQEPAPPEKPAKKMRIDEITVKIGTAERYRYTAGVRDPKIEKIEINRERTYKNITDTQQIVSAIMQEVLLVQAQRGLSQLAKEHEKDIDRAAKELDKLGEGLGKSLKGLVKDVSGDR